MAKLRINNFFLYRRRYAVSFVVIGILLALIILAVSFLSPGGISKAEMQSAVTSTYTQPKALMGQSPENIIHLPYRLFQKLSLAALDVNLISIKLPSLVLAVGSVLALYGLLRLWFRRNVAVITATIVVATGQFLLLSQLGTPAIGYIFWNSAILYCVSMLARTEKFRPLWFITATIFAALSMYSPLQLYVVIALIAACFFHPHARFVVFRQSKWVLGTGGLLFLLLITPLVISLAKQPALIKTLLGIPPQLSMINLELVQTQLSQYAGFYKSSSDVRITPAYGLGVIALALVGLGKLFTTKYTAKSYIITVWFILLLPAVLINPDAVMVTFVPVVLLVAYGVDYLIRSWYRLFPHNPYARVFGLAPLSVLVIGLIISGGERFLYSYHYDPQASNVFTSDLAMLDKTVDTYRGKTVSLVVPEDQRDFYTIYAMRKNVQPKLIVHSAAPAAPTDVVLYHRGSSAIRPQNPSKILVSAISNDADRFYLYKKPTK